jgi:hypothetical protein
MDGNKNVTATFTQLEYTLDVADQDIPVSGTVSGGDYTNTHSSNDDYEQITEVQSGGKSNRSYLEHKWTINVIGGAAVIFYIEAYHSPNSEGDDFEFSYSTDDNTYTYMLTVDETGDPDAYQTFVLPSNLSGTVYIRVTDTDQTRGNMILDTIYIDHMYIVSSGTRPPNRFPEKPSAPDPADGTTGVEITPILSVYAYDPDGDAMDISFYLNGEEIGIVPDVPSGSRASLSLSDLAYNTTYSWYAIATDDGPSSTTSDTWLFTTGGETQPGGMYVWDISWASAGKNLKSSVTIRWDSDGDGVAESTDELVVGAIVYYKLTYEPSQPNSDLMEYAETTDTNGQISVQWKKAAAGNYEGIVTNIESGTHTYTPELDCDNPDYYEF